MLELTRPLPQFSFFPFRPNNAMKFIWIVTAALLPFGLSAVAWADSPPVESAPTQISQPEPTSGQAADLMTQGARAEDPNAEDAEHLDSLARQINQSLSTDGHRQPTKLQEMLNLPRGMIIRGSPRGGLSIGTEL
jgi:hypothetical protein